jgi:hypothetical protein
MTAFWLSTVKTQNHDSLKLDIIDRQEQSETATPFKDKPQWDGKQSVPF